mgnify:CR=1 FL=1
MGHNTYKPCPNCGYCPTCGRSRNYPINWPYIHPYNPWRIVPNYPHSPYYSGGIGTTSTNQNQISATSTTYIT